ncbi:hypothetical protein [Niabella aurantiaca]|uniref:hypothetical protein n=1 Tax=Niabella aurantiaca TaxID=379900 RepID=UPI00059475FC|nr:hypothetical protein [Niabella aurantiaca]
MSRIFLPIDLSGFNRNVGEYEPDYTLGQRTGGAIGDFLGNNAGNLIQVMWDNYYYYYQY